MGSSPLSPLCITGIRFDGTTPVLAAREQADDAPCRACGERRAPGAAGLLREPASRRVHTHYRRFPLDLPWRGFVVRQALTVQRFRYDGEYCRRRPLAEAFGPVVGHRRRCTAAAQAALREFALALGGRAGSRLAERQDTPASRPTLWRLLHDGEPEAASTPRVLGVDDLALRRGGATPLRSWIWRRTGPPICWRGATRRRSPPGCASIPGWR